MADKPLTSIPSTPAGAPKEIVGWMGAVRSRLEGIEDQFTASEVTRLRALLSAKPLAAPVAAAASSIVFLTSPVAFYSGGGENLWKSYSAKDAGVPAGSKGVIIQSIWWLVGKVGIVTRSARLRIDSTLGNSDPSSGTFCLCNSVGTNDNGSDAVSGSQQGMYPLRPDGSFDYMSKVSSDGWSGIYLEIVGYIS